MTYIENIFICLAIPMALATLFTENRAGSYIRFVVLGMATCLLSAYVSSFFMGYYGTDAVVTAIEITPVCEEIMKLLPLLFYYLIFEPKPEQLPGAALALAVGFATFENVCYLTENGAQNFTFLLIRGISAGALHILCGTLAGFGISYVCRRRWLAVTGTVGLLGACIGMHAIYNLLITAQGILQLAGYVFPSVLILCLHVVQRGAPIIKNSR